MKKTILLFILISGFSFAQIKSEIIKKSETISWVNDVFLKKNDDFYSLCFYNNKYLYTKPTACITFPEKENNLEELYKIMINGFDNYTGDITKIELAGNTIWLDYSKMLGIITVNISKIEYGILTALSNSLTRKQVEKLFTKKK